MLITLLIVDKFDRDSLTTQKIFISICVFFVLKLLLTQFGVGVGFYLEFRLIIERISTIITLRNISMLPIEP